MDTISSFTPVIKVPAGCAKADFVQQAEPQITLVPTSLDQSRKRELCKVHNTLKNNILFCKITFRSGNNSIPQLGCDPGEKTNECFSARGCLCH